MNYLNETEREKVKQSYFNLLALFLSMPSIENRFVRCLIKWSAQIGISSDDIVRLGKDLEQLTYAAPQTEEEKVKSLFHLVHMIYLDRITEDVELEVAMIYAEQIGFDKSLVAKIFQSIATASGDGTSPEMLEKEIMDILHSS